jgi:regulator of protease activity HflC (stomatin/prohibitin superfamily)
LAIIDVSTAIILIIILIIGAVIANRIFQRRRRQRHIIQEPRENIYHDDNKNQRVNIDTTEARSSSIISGLPVIQNKLKIIAALATFIFIIIILAESVVIVQAGHRGVVLYLGAVENRVLGEGWHFIIPFAEQVIQLEVRTLKYQAEASAASNDLQAAWSRLF